MNNKRHDINVSDNQQQQQQHQKQQSIGSITLTLLTFLQNLHTILNNFRENFNRF